MAGLRSSGSRPRASSSACRMLNGPGGDPGSHTSTGTTPPTPPAVAYDGLDSPPLTASVPTAMTTFGCGMAS